MHRKGAFFILSLHIYAMGDAVNKLDRYLPTDILTEIKGYGRINEIRLKRNSYIVIKRDDRYFTLNVKTDSATFDVIVDNLLEHSYHSKLSGLIEGYISLGDGYRVGVAGQAVVHNGAVTNLSEIGSVNIRIPHLIRGVCQPVTEYLRTNNFTKGVLIYSPPGVGKTTLLRDLILTLAQHPYIKRISVIDSRNELYHPIMDNIPMLDIYASYPKHKGIEQAIRTMSPDLIICDEIGNVEETDALLLNQSSGVPMIATAHGDSVTSLIMRNNIRRMDEHGVFGCYIGIRRKGVSEKYDFEFTECRYGV